MTTRLMISYIFFIKKVANIHQDIEDTLHQTLKPGHGCHLKDVALSCNEITHLIRRAPLKQSAMDPLSFYASLQTIPMATIINLRTDQLFLDTCAFFCTI